MCIRDSYFSIHRQQMLDNQLLQVERDSIQNDLGRLMTDFDNLRITNDTFPPVSVSSASAPIR